MRRREFLKYSAAAAVTAPFVRVASADTGVYKVARDRRKNRSARAGRGDHPFPALQTLGA